jgi:uncharacterized membrane protein
MGKSSRRRRESAGGVVTRRERTLDRPAIFPDGPVLQGEIFPDAIIRHQEFMGPLPPPALLLDYDTILPGLGERIVRMAEVEGDHRRAIEKQLTDLSVWGLFGAAVICVIALVGGFVLLYAGKTLSGLAPILLALGGLIATFVVQRNSPPPADTTTGAQGSRD